MTEKAGISGPSNREGRDFGEEEEVEEENAEDKDRLQKKNSSQPNILQGDKRQRIRKGRREEEGRR